MFSKTTLKNPSHYLGANTTLFFTYMHFSQDVCTALFVPLLPLIRGDLGLSYLQSGLLLSAYNVTSGLSQFLGGYLGSRVKLQSILALGLAGTGISLILAGLSPGYYHLLIFLVVVGIFSGGYHPAANSALSSCFEAGKRGKVVGLHMMGGTLASVVAPFAGGLIADQLNWHYAFVFLSAPALIAASIVFRVLKQPIKQDPGSSIRPPDTADIKAMQTQEMKRWGKIWGVWRPVLAITTLTLLSQVMAQAAVAFIPMYFVDKYGTAPIYAAMFIGIMRLGGFPGGLFSGWLTDRLGARNAAVVALASTGPALYLLTKVPVNASIMVTLVVLGAIFIGRQTAVQTYLMDNTPFEIRTLVFGIYFGLSHEGASLAQPLVGYLMDLYGIEPVFDGIALLSIGLSLAALLLLRSAGRFSPVPKAKEY